MPAKKTKTFAQTNKAKQKAAIAERNRKNAQKSTGPRTEAGKAVSRGNALTHGLTGNPAIPIAEDPEGYLELYHSIQVSIEPKNVIEEHSVAQIAYSIWRLRRSKNVETAIATMAAAEVTALDQRKVDEWHQRITEDWEAICIREEEERQYDKLGRALPRRRDEPSTTREWYERPGLARLDAMWDEISTDPFGLKAVTTMLDQLSGEITDHPRQFSHLNCQKLAWLISGNAQRYEQAVDMSDVQRGAFYPDEQLWANELEKLIGEARKRDAHHPVPQELIEQCAARRAYLTQQYREQMPLNMFPEQLIRCTASMLLDGPTMDRLLRYETHAMRTLKSALKQLAEFRNESITMIMQRVTQTTDETSTTTYTERIESQQKMPRV